MNGTNTALILAAGNGSRLKNVSGRLPKPLVRIYGKPLLEHVILGSQVAGIEKFVIVVGQEGDAIRSWVTNRNFPGAQFQFVQNSDYMLANGVSALKARDYIDRPFLLLMSDHLFDPFTAASLLCQPINPGETILAVDYKIDSIFDMDDATKVDCRGGYITNIGKSLTRFNAVDTGMFLCTPGLFYALERSMMDENCSLSDGMRFLAACRKLRAFDIGQATWQDVDTPEMLEYASNSFFERDGRDLAVAEAGRV